jgi:hypothetical protein
MVTGAYHVTHRARQFLTKISWRGKSQRIT